MKLLLLFLLSTGIYSQTSDWEDLRQVRHSRVIESEYQRLGVSLNQDRFNDMNKWNLVMLFVILIFVGGILFAFYDGQRNVKQHEVKQLTSSEYITRAEFKELLLAIQERKQRLIE